MVFITATENRPGHSGIITALSLSLYSIKNVIFLPGLTTIMDYIVAPKAITVMYVLSANL